MALEHRKTMTKEDALWERIHAMEKVLAYVGECAGVEPGDVDGLIDWADSHRVQPSNAPAQATAKAAHDAGKN